MDDAEIWKQQAEKSDRHLIQAYVELREARAEIERLRAEIERLVADLSAARDR